MVQHTQRICKFLSDIGLVVVEGELSEDTFLPGIKVIDGEIVIDSKRLKYPGDILHEAGHLALLNESERQCWNGNFFGSAGYEMGAIAWSYAACVYLKLPVDVLFHDDGYKGEAEWLRELFSSGSGVGIPILEWKEMASSQGTFAYPLMKSWLCPQV